MEVVNLDDEVDADSGETARVAQGLPEPRAPTAAERARHNLNHWPYRSWCEHCVACRRPNTAHKTSHPSDCTVPVFVADYCYLRDSRDEDIATCLVGRLYPSRTFDASVVTEKGLGDDAAIEELKTFFRENGVRTLVYKSDQERSLKAFTDEALKRAGVSVSEDDDSVACAVPEYSAVG